jgi:hypothetical protein
MAQFKLNPSNTRVGYLTLINEDGSQETIEIRNIVKFRVEDDKHDRTKIKIVADTKIEYRPAPPLPKRVYDLTSLHRGLHLTYGLIHGRIEDVRPVETSDGCDNWNVCAVNVTVGGRDYRFNDNDPITVTRFI